MTVIKNVAPYQDADGNKIIGAPTNPGAGSINFKARNCTVEFGDKVAFFGAITFHKDGGSVVVGADSFLRAAISLGEDCVITFGAKMACAGMIDVATYDGAPITVGDDCLFAEGVQLRGWDQHPIYDLRTGKRTNWGRPVLVGNRVWMAKGAVALPGSQIGDGSIIGMRSMVSAGSPVPPHCVAVGTPARVVKRYAAWAKGPALPELRDWESYPSPESLPYFEPNESPSDTGMGRSTLGIRVAKALHVATGAALRLAMSRRTP